MVWTSEHALQRPGFLLFWDSLTQVRRCELRALCLLHGVDAAATLQFSFGPGGWGAGLVDRYQRKVGC